MSPEQSSALDFLNEERIFSCEISERKTELIFTEACDNYFKARLTKPEVFRLINEFKSLYDQMEY